jgi:hypothetical protein
MRPRRPVSTRDRRRVQQRVGIPDCPGSHRAQCRWASPRTGSFSCSLPGQRMAVALDGDAGDELADSTAGQAEPLGHSPLAQRRTRRDRRHVGRPHRLLHITRHRRHGGPLMAACGTRARLTCCITTVPMNAPRARPRSAPRAGRIPPAPRLVAGTASPDAVRGRISEPSLKQHG